MESRQVAPFLWQVNKTKGAFKPPLITPRTTESEVRYAIGQQHVVDTLKEWATQGRSAMLQKEFILTWENIFLPPKMELDTPMHIIMFWAGVFSVIQWMSTNIID